MATVDRAKAVLDNLKGSVFDPARALEIAQGFIHDDTLPNEETAQIFLDTLVGSIKQTVKSHATQDKAATNDAEEEQAGEDAVIDL